MEAMNPPPRLFMRSVTIMVTNAAAPLMKWVITLLERLIQKQVSHRDYMPEPHVHKILQALAKAIGGATF
jgi:hypothetical protein